ncbi:MAG TPA: caspase family protein, partial [Armatimonadota bacterium]|nr:caspase family protein [Armatimonadota bacterium]
VWDAATTRLLATCLSLPAGEGPKPIAVGAKPIVLGAKPIVLGAKPIVLGAKDVSDVEYLTFTPEGYYAGSAAADRYVRFRFGEDLFPAESFQARYYRPDLVKQSLAGAELPVVSAFQGPYPPVIGFTSHQDGAKVKGGTLSVTVEATDDQGVNSVALFVNGARVDAKPLLVGSKPIVLGAKPIVLGAKAVPATHRVTRTYTVAVPLPPNETTVWVQAIAFDGDQLQSPREEILFTQDKTAAATGRLLGLCVGVSRYADAALNLQYADKDATTLAEELNKQRGIYKTAEVTPLANDQATRDGVKAALDGLVGKATRADTVILFLSGHGWRSDERSFYFATHEVNRANVAATALPWSEVVERLARLSERSKRVIVLLDACHSGSAANNEELVKGVLSANAGVMVFASSKGSEVSLESPELMHGVFTKALLEGISGRATPPDEKQVTVLDFLAYVARRVKTLTNDTQHPHIPFLQDFETDSALVTVTTAAAQ